MIHRRRLEPAVRAFSKRPVSRVSRHIRRPPELRSYRLHWPRSRIRVRGARKPEWTILLEAGEPTESSRARAQLVLEQPPPEHALHDRMRDAPETDLSRSKPSPMSFWSCAPAAPEARAQAATAFAARAPHLHRECGTSRFMAACAAKGVLVAGGGKKKKKKKKKKAKQISRRWPQGQYAAGRDAADPFSPATLWLQIPCAAGRRMGIQRAASGLPARIRERGTTPQAHSHAH